nr:MAG TPA: hypothetical protein [Caudoviricetes sp.]DAL34453.1 MAG TPA_asm: hypothetical protein [Caudoviricetes sp.]DAM23569.1 MAG TPA: hypothetical protein [Caudoviricetes sp.]
MAGLIYIFAAPENSSRPMICACAWLKISPLSQVIGNERALFDPFYTIEDHTFWFIARGHSSRIRKYEIFRLNRVPVANPHRPLIIPDSWRRRWIAICIVITFVDGFIGEIKHRIDYRLYFTEI